MPNYIHPKKNNFKQSFYFKWGANSRPFSLELKFQHRFYVVQKSLVMVTTQKSLKVENDRDNSSVNELNEQNRGNVNIVSRGSICANKTCTSKYSQAKTAKQAFDQVCNLRSTSSDGIRGKESEKGRKSGTCREKRPRPMVGCKDKAMMGENLHMFEHVGLFGIRSSRYDSKPLCHVYRCKFKSNLTGS